MTFSARRRPEKVTSKELIKDTKLKTGQKYWYVFFYLRNFSKSWSNWQSLSGLAMSSSSKFRLIWPASTLEVWKWFTFNVTRYNYRMIAFVYLVWRLEWCHDLAWQKIVTAIQVCSNAERRALTYTTIQLFLDVSCHIAL